MVLQTRTGQGSIGKTVAQRLYVHVSALDRVDSQLVANLREAERITGISHSERYNVVRFEPATSQVALLRYQDFSEDPFPGLKESRRVDVATGDVGYRTYEDSLNPPILRRKELSLAEDHPRWAEYAALTEAAEAIGLFDYPTRIGYRRQWEQLVREKGYCIAGLQLVPIGNDEVGEIEAGEDQGPLHASWEAARHLTALVRYGFSAPVQTLARYGFLDGSNTLFDYGCGRGDDVPGLVENGVTASGWDPYHAPDNPITSADIVNLGFVVNVIEDYEPMKGWGELANPTEPAWETSAVVLRPNEQLDP